MKVVKKFLLELERFPMDTLFQKKSTILKVKMVRDIRVLKNSILRIH